MLPLAAQCHSHYHFIHSPFCVIILKIKDLVAKQQKYMYNVLSCCHTQAYSWLEYKAIVYYMYSYVIYLYSQPLTSVKTISWKWPLPLNILSPFSTLWQLCPVGYTKCTQSAPVIIARFLCYQKCHPLLLTKTLQRDSVQGNKPIQLLTA